MSELGVTVVVPTLNRGGYLPACLEDLAAQRHRPLEILVVDQSAEVGEEVVRVIGRYPDLITHRRVGFRGLPRARNYGWQAAKYESIVFVDDDIRCGPGLISEHLHALCLPGVGLVGGGIDTLCGQPDWRRRPGTYRRWTATPLRGFASGASCDADHAAGCNFSAWRHALVKVGGFDEALGAEAALYEETDLCLRVKGAGFRVYFHGAARLTHLAGASGGCRVDRVGDYVRGLARNRCSLIRRHGRWFQLPVALGWLAALGLSYARFYRSPSALSSGLAGAWQGLREGGLAPVCTAFVPGECT